MKGTIISMLVVLVLLVAAPMFFMGDGKFADMFDFGGGTVKLPKNLESVKTDSKVELYKWRDANGVMQFSQTPPQDGGASARVVLSPDENVIDAVKVPEKVVSRPNVMSVGNPYNPGTIKDIVKDSQDIQNKLNERHAGNEQMMKDMFK